MRLSTAAVLALTVMSLSNVEAGEPTCESVIPQQGRSEPSYVGMKGFLIPGKFWHPKDYMSALPDYPWRVPILEQTGPRVWGGSDKTLPAKTAATVKAQFLKHEGYGRYRGLLEVQLLDGSGTVHVNVKTFTPAPYWECRPYRAAQYGPFIAEILPDTRPVRDGRWAKIGEEKRVFCTGRSRTKDVAEGVECLMYRQYRLGFGGVQHVFPSAGLKIVY